MVDNFSRTRLLLGDEGMSKLQNSKVAVFGIGGVGGHAVEAIVRSGVGYIDLFDNDKVATTNINRQIVALESTIGQYKTKVMKNRIVDINPNAIVNTFDVFYMPENADDFDLSKYDYIVDAIDTVTAKIELITRAKSLNIPIISSMGAGNKLNPTMLEVSDIYKTSVCPLAKVMRYELKKRGIKKLKVVYSKEQPIKPSLEGYEEISNKRNIAGSTSFVPSVAGLIIASEIIKDISCIKN